MIVTSWETATLRDPAITSQRPPARPPAVHPSGTRRKDIQGLRAIAVVSVVLFHARVHVPGGFVGVDVFFVISGYVITAMLLRERTSSGRINLGTFYLRRFKRLTPALAAMVTTTAALSLAILPRLGPQGATGATGVGAMLLAANFVIAVTTGDYFDAPADANPLLHTWSLSVEEQFYLVFPTVLAVGWLLARRSRRVNSSALVLVAAIAAGSFVLALIGSSGTDGADTVLGFYSPFTRAWEFAVGALIVLGAGKTAIRSAHLNTMFAGIGTIALFSSFWLIDGDQPFSSAWNLLPVGGTAILLFAGQAQRTNVSGILASRPMVAIGDWSYSIYLWHWPMIVFAVTLWPLHDRAAPIAAAASIVPALMSYYFLEKPIRAIGRLSRPRMTILVAATVLPALVTATAVYTIGRHDRQDDEAATAAQSQAPVAPGFASPVVENIGHKESFTYTAEHFAPCTPESLRRNADSWEGIVRCQQSKAGVPPTVALIGDSHMEHLFLGFAEALPGENVVYYSSPGLPIRPRFEPILAYVQSEPAIHTVFVGARWGFERPEGSLAVAELVDTLTTLRAAGKSVVVFDDVPNFRFTPGECKLATSADDPACTQDAPDFQERYREYLDKLEQAVAEVPGVTLVQTAPYFCNDTVCSMRVDGYLMYRDQDHLGMTGSRYIARQVLADHPSLLPDEPRLRRELWFAPRGAAVVSTSPTSIAAATPAGSVSETSAATPPPAASEQDPRIAIRRAAAAAPGARIVGADSGTADDREYLAFTMMGPDGASVRVLEDFSTSEVIAIEPTATPDLAATSLPPVSAEQALDTAFSQVSHAMIRGVTLVSHDGQLFWSIELDASGGRRTLEISAG